MTDAERGVHRSSDASSPAQSSSSPDIGTMSSSLFISPPTSSPDHHPMSSSLFTSPPALSSVSQRPHPPSASSTPSISITKQGQGRASAFSAQETFAWKQIKATLGSDFTLKKFDPLWQSASRNSAMQPGGLAFRAINNDQFGDKKRREAKKAAEASAGKVAVKKTKERVTVTIKHKKRKLSEVASQDGNGEE